MRYDSGRCTNAAVGELPICGPCLGVVLAEGDPGRRRSLAGLTRLPRPVADRLVDDPDAGVRARIANREDLAGDTVSRFADPAREPSPIVWRSFAATRIGAANAAAVLATRDRLAMLVLAANPATPSETLDRLAGLDDVEIATTVAATRAGQPPEDTVISQVLGARAIATRPLAEAPAGTPWPGGPTPRQAAVTPTGPDPVDDDDSPASHRGLVVGFVVAAVIVVAVAALIARGGSSDDDMASSSNETAGVTVPSPGSTSSPDVMVAGRSPSTTSKSATGSGGNAVVFDLAMTARQKNFCDEADIKISFDGPTAYVVITDDTDRELWTGPWNSGATKQVDLIAPSKTLHARLTTTGDPDDFRPSGSVQGTFC
ncbi:MAG TPA: hypothetical protein VFN21_01195 [Acidimicrobiales bacterium]|nr:hypothetical protein [Acidimicrobiales bacterium]